MRCLKLFALSCMVLATVLSAPRAALGQYSINSSAGGGPNNLNALLSSIGYPGCVAIDAVGNIYIADSYSSHIFKVDTTGNLTVVAGNGTLGYSGDGGPATSAALNRPEGVFVDGSGNIFIADTDNSVIREVLASTGNIQTVAGDGTQGYKGDNGPATSAELYDPFGVYVDGSGNIFIADTDNSVIREVVAGTGNIQTVAGTGTACTAFTATECGDGGPATSALLDEPQGVFLDSAGDIYIADTYNSVIRKVSAGTGVIAAVAGTYYDWATNDTCQYSGDNGPATSAQLCLPTTIFVDSSSNLFIADTNNSVIREVAAATGNITSLAGNNALGAGYSGDNGPATSAQLNYPSGVYLDSTGDIFIADTENFVIRRVVASTGDIQTNVGNNTLAFSGDGGSPTSAALNYPQGVLLDSSGNLYIVDTANSVIRVYNLGAAAVTIAGVTIQPGDIQTVAGTGGFSCQTPSQACGDGGAATSAQLNSPGSIAFDNAGDIFIADTGDSKIREVLASTGVIETVAGNGTEAFAGDGAAPTSASLYHPYGVALDSAGNVYIADTENSVIRVVNPGTAAATIANITIEPNTIQTVAGTGPTACADPSGGCGDGGAAISAYLKFPGGIALDSAGDIFIADSDDHAIREVYATSSPAGTPGFIQTVAGTLGQSGYSGDNGPPTSALLANPQGVFVDSSGNIFIADSDSSAIREVVAVADIIVTAAGNGIAGFSGDGGSSNSAELNTPYGVAVSSDGTIFIADTDNSRIRQLTSTTTIAVVPSTATVPVGSSGTQQFVASVSSTSTTSSATLVAAANHASFSARLRSLERASAAQQNTSTLNPSVTWQVNGITGGNSTVGTISSVGLYQAPATAPSSVVTVTAVSDANGITAGSAIVTFASSGTPTVTVSTSPSGITDVYTGTSQTFNVAVNGSTSQAVNWQVSCVGSGAGNSNCGSVTSGGVYTAPASVPKNPLVLIAAVLQANANVSGAYPLKVVTAPSATSPSSQTISPGQTATYSVSLNANTGDPNQPITLTCLESSLPEGATCTFSPAAITPGSQAVPFSFNVTVPPGITSASVQQPAGLLLSRQLCFAFTPLASVLLIARSSQKRRARWLWLVLLFTLPLAVTACGGGGGGGTTSPTNPEVGSYTIQVQGTTTAQPHPITITTAGLTVK